ncbi:MAG: hypothetical protein ACFFED_00790 [Candidatus Thorarchaeota archaeon]
MELDQDTMRKLSESFGLLFLLSQRFEYMTDSVLRDDNLTTKQLLTLISIGSVFDHVPSISEVAEVMSTSHQNIKKIAVQLQRRRFVEIIDDDKDRRKKRLRTTKENDDFWSQRAQDHTNSLMQLFSSLTKQELFTFHSLVTKLIDSTDTLYRETRNG